MSVVRLLFLVALLGSQSPTPNTRHSILNCSPSSTSPAQLGALPNTEDRTPKTHGWHASGTLFEACSCSVPCPCNFGQGPSRGYCHTVYAYKLKSAEFDGVTLDGLVFGGGEAGKSPMGFLDSRATAEQREPLKMLALAVFGKGGPSAGDRSFITVKIDANQTASAFHARFGETGGFDADILIGGDGTKPIIVENNTTWPVARFIKGKTTKFDYHDANGNVMKFTGVNANVGEFDLKP